MGGLARMGLSFVYRLREGVCSKALVWTVGPMTIGEDFPHGSGTDEVEADGRLPGATSGESVVSRLAAAFSGLARRDRCRSRGSPRHGALRARRSRQWDVRRPAGAAPRGRHG